MMPQKTGKQAAALQREAGKWGEVPVMPPVHQSVAADATYMPLREDSESDTKTGPSTSGELWVHWPTYLTAVYTK
jgi:hypothetical protein